MANKRICQVVNCSNPAERFTSTICYEHGRLLDAAPALLEALEAVIFETDRCEHYEGGRLDEDARNSLAKARAAISQAKGETK